MRLHATTLYFRTVAFVRQTQKAVARHFSSTGSSGPIPRSACAGRTRVSSHSVRALRPASALASLHKSTCFFLPLNLLSATCLTVPLACHPPKRSFITRASVDSHRPLRHRFHTHIPINLSYRRPETLVLLCVACTVSLRRAEGYKIGRHTSDAVLGGKRPDRVRFRRLCGPATFRRHIPFPVTLCMLKRAALHKTSSPR